MTEPESPIIAQLNAEKTSLFPAVASPSDSYNEAFSASGKPREHWQSLLNALEKKGASSLTRAYERAGHMRHDDGATINPFDDPLQRSTAWDLDPVPLLIDAAEWSQVEAGLTQRAHLLEKILADVYGEQQLVKSGSLPVELVFANPNFIYSCHNIRPPGNRFLSFYAADIYRSGDGRFRVLRDYAASPGGLGYALENRIVMSRVFSELYHTTQTLRLAPFFMSFF